MVLTTAPKYKNISNNINKWLDIHFGDTSFNGRAVIGRKEKDGSLHTMTAQPLTELRPYIKTVYSSPSYDYYITANTVAGIKRRKNELFGLQNIVIDIDCHENDRHYYNVSSLIQAFIWRSKRDLWEAGVIPAPNSIVRTGRGVQLWWAIKPCYGGRDYEISRYHHKKIKNNFINHIKKLLAEYEEELEGLEVCGASSNLVGYFRLPYTYNSSANCYSSLDILHTQRFDQRELTKLEAPEIEDVIDTSAIVTKYIPMQETDREILKSFQSTGVQRVMHLIKLRNLRNNEAGAETRNFFNFSVYNALRMTFNHREAMVHLESFNAGFKEPMTKRELRNCISSAKDKEGYKYTNAKLIELLGITPEEQRAIGLVAYPNKRFSKPNASRDAVRKALKNDRDNKIIEMLNQGVSQAEIARELGIGKNTVNRFVKGLREEEKASQDDVIEVEFSTENGRHQNGSIYVTVKGSELYEEAPSEGFFGIPTANSS